MRGIVSIEICALCATNILWFQFYTLTLKGFLYGLQFSALFSYKGKYLVTIMGLSPNTIIVLLTDILIHYYNYM